jgi:hypothetical protein
VANGTAERAAEVVALKIRNLLPIEIVACVECAVAQELIRRAMQPICAAGSNDTDLCALAFAESGGVRVAGDIEFAHRVNAEQLAAGTAGSDIDKRRAGVLDAIEQEEIVLRAPSGNGEHIADG